MRPPKQQGFSQRQPLAYDDLNNDKREIRILTLLPDSWRARIRCSLTIVSLDDKPDYEVLSYAWGNPEDTFPIFVNDCVFHITVNLWYALRRLRGNAPRILWIDAICINQRADDEKSVQVAMMKDIYTKCRAGLLWLGEDFGGRASKRYSSTKTRRAVTLLKLLAQDMHFSEQAWFDLPPGQSVLRVKESYRKCFRSLREIVTLDWWKRVWVLQEASLPPQVTFIRASESIPFDLFRDAYRAFRKHTIGCCYSLFHQVAAAEDSSLHHFIDAFHPFRIREAYQKGNRISLFFLTATSSMMKATMPQDTIYGFLGLVTIKGGAPIRPDYSRPVPEAFVDAVLAMIEKDSSLRILNGRREVGRAAVAIPTWIPDHLLSSVYKQKILYIWRRLSTCRASAGLFEMPEKIDNFVIKARALRISTVEAVAPVLEKHEDFYPTLEKWREFVKEAEVSSQKKIATHMPQAKRFWNLVLKGTKSEFDLEQLFHCRPSDIPWRSCEKDYQKGYAAWGAAKDADPSFYLRDTFSLNLRQAPNMRMFITSDGRLGMTRDGVAKGCEVYLLIGGTAPFVLQRNTHSPFTKDPRHSIPVFSVVGEFYLEGVMDGELLEGDWRDRVEEIALS